MKVTHTWPKTGWVSVANSAARDHRLSWRARGLLLELLSFPDDWKTSVDKLVDMAAAEDDSHTEGRDSMRTAMHELVKYGYVNKTRCRERGRWIVRMSVKDAAHTTPEIPAPVDPSPVSPAPEIPASLQRRTRNTETKKDLIRDEGMDAEQPKSGEGRGVRKGIPKVGEVDGWPVVVLPGEGLNGTRWADRLYERE